MPFFSIIIPTYNRAELLPNALNSVVNQTFGDWELIVVDDGGDDDSENVVRKFSEQNNKIQYVKIKHGGHVKAKNKGIKSAKGRYITFLDSDDEYKPVYLETYYSILQANDYDLLYSLTEIVGEEYVEDLYNPGQLIHIDDCTVGGTFCVKKEIFSRVGFFPELAYGDDAVFFNAVKNAGMKIYRSELRNYIYKRTGEDSITKRKIEI